MITFVIALDPLMSTFKLIGLMILFSAIFIIIGMFPLHVINKTISDKLNDGEMLLAVGIPAVISSLIQWILLFFKFLSIRHFVIIVFFFNFFLYFFVYFKLRAKRIREHPDEEYV